MNEKPNFRPQAEAQAIAKLLRTAAIGDIITYDQMSRACGGDSLDEIRGFIRTARRIVEREDNIVFGTITGIGIKRLDPAGIVDSTKSKLTHVRRAARRAAATLACADISQLPAAKRSEALCLQAQMGAIQLASSLTAQHQLEQKIIDGKRIEIGNVIDFFKAKSAA